MVAIATGVWWDYSKSSTSSATLTLSTTSSNYLLSALAFLVTLAGTSAWNMMAFLLHWLKTRQTTDSPTHVIDLMHQVSLRNSAGSISTLWEAIKIHRAWSSSSSKRQSGLENRDQNKQQQHSPSPPPQLLKKTCMVAVPALLVWVVFAIAAVFTSNVANSKGYGTPIIARLQPQNCGFWNFNTTTSDGYAASLMKKVNDTTQARSYVTNFYANTSKASPARSLFITSALPYNVSTVAPCPVPAAKRCLGGPNSAFEMTSAALDSHTMLGVNAQPSDRVTIQIKVTCSPVGVGSFAKQSNINDSLFLDLSLGSVGNASTNVTYRHKVDAERTGVGYMISTLYAYAKNDFTISLWEPIPEFNRTDADVSIYFLSQNAMYYLDPVYDRWFSANGTYSIPLEHRNVTRPDYLVNTMVCAEQYILCNPSTSFCTPISGWVDLLGYVHSGGTMEFNRAQTITAMRIVNSLINASTYGIVGDIGIAALWANSKVIMNTMSPGLPPNQWQIEVLGWFQTVLARLQASLVEFASNDNGLSPYATPVSTVSSRTLFNHSAAFNHQCTNQLVSTAGEVQNFNLVGIIVIICLSLLLILLDWSLESIVNLINKRRGWDSPSKRARQADAKLHLLRMALDGTIRETSGWGSGSLGIPVLDAAVVAVERPTASGDLVSYTTRPM